MTDHLRQLAAQISDGGVTSVAGADWVIGGGEQYLELGEPLPEDFGEKSERRAPLAAFLASLTLHLLCVIFLLTHWERLPISQPPPMVVEISLQDLPLDELVPPPPAPRQIVSPSAAENRPPPPETRQQSDRDQSTPVERIKRGDGGQPAKQSPPQQKSAPAESRPEKQTPPPKAETPKNERAAEKSSKANEPPAERPAPRPRRDTPLLKLDDKTMAARFGEVPVTARTASDEGGGPQSERPPPTERERISKFHRREPFSRAESISLFSGRGGSPDYLPQVQDGDITLLNAKADRHAVFVRRVALQVFGSLRRQSWHELPLAEVRRLRDFVKVKARMTTAGKLIDVELLESSGSSVFDKLLVAAARESCWDQNPPKEAVAEDGTISFVFESRTWARGAAGNAREQRWLLLGTGLL